MTSVEKNLALVLQNQMTQDELLQRLLNTHFGSSSMLIDDNKKGKRIGEEKGQQISCQEKDRQLSSQEKGRQLSSHRQIVQDQHISSDQQITDGKRKSHSSTLPIAKKANVSSPKKTWIKAIKERRRVREAETRRQAQEGQKQLEDMQKKKKMIKEDVGK